MRSGSTSDPAQRNVNTGAGFGTGQAPQTGARRQLLIRCVLWSRAREIGVRFCAWDTTVVQDAKWFPAMDDNISAVDVLTRIIKSRRFDIILELRAVTWRRIQFEVSPDEASISEHRKDIEPPPLRGFGLPDPDALIGIGMRSQIAQKFHAVSDMNEPSHAINDRARDVIDQPHDRGSVLALCDDLEQQDHRGGRRRRRGRRRR